LTNGGQAAYNIVDKKLGGWSVQSRMVNMNEYKERDHTLMDIGFDSYQQYLDSRLWKEIKQKVFELRGNICKVCCKEADILHHRHYHKDVLLGRSYSGLVPLCNGCHYKIEFTSQKVKRSLDKANDRLDILLKNHKDVVKVVIKKKKQRKTKKQKQYHVHQSFICLKCNHYGITHSRIKKTKCPRCGSKVKGYNIDKQHKELEYECSKLDQHVNDIMKGGV
jgi:rubrerythrin